MNMLDYLECRGGISFAEQNLNEVDNLIFSTLVYLDMEDFISSDDSRCLTLRELCAACEKAGMDTSHTHCDPMQLLRAAAQTNRFQEVSVCYYSSLYDTEAQVQFAAVTFVYAPGWSYVAFRGTDNTITGWREDCNFSYLIHTPGQTAAAEYLNDIARHSCDSLIVGGHSKGGNIAVYAAAFCDEKIRNTRIRKVYSNDGPGFNSEIAASKNYMEILEKEVKIIPESSIVGILLSSKAKRIVITSSARGIFQHNPYSWNVSEDHFETADGRSIASILIGSALSSWISSLDAQEKQQIIDSFFDALESSGAETMHDLKVQKKETALALLKAMIELDPQKRKMIAASFGKFFTSGKENILSGFTHVSDTTF